MDIFTRERRSSSKRPSSRSRQGSRNTTPTKTPLPSPPPQQLPSPPAWSPSSCPQQPPPVAPPYYPQQTPYMPIVVHQNYYVVPPQDSRGVLSKFNIDSVINVADQLFPTAGINQFFDDGLPPWHPGASQMLNQSAAVYDQLSTKFDDVMTWIDQDRCPAKANDFYGAAQQSLGGLAPNEMALMKPPKKVKPGKDQPKGQTTAVAAAVFSGDVFAKVECYANSKLPLGLPPLKLYIPTWPLICLAAQYAESVYTKPKGSERQHHVDADWRTGTKAMVIKSVPMDFMNTIVFAIRGTSTFMDWAVNLNMAPATPDGFLDDTGNFCHAGFLAVARRMVRPVASRLRQLLEEDPRRASYSLLITGHSAGGAIASLLYAHMHASSPRAASELNALTSCFRRVHCVTFGTPPVSLLPLARPSEFGALKRSLFLTFINEGDPVARADRAYVRSLLDLLSKPAPVVSSAASPAAGDGKQLLVVTATAAVTGGTYKYEKPCKWDKQPCKRCAAACRKCAVPCCRCRCSERPHCRRCDQVPWHCRCDKDKDKDKKCCRKCDKSPCRCREDEKKKRDGKKKDQDVKSTPSPSCSAGGLPCPGPIWRVPPSTLSCPGRIVVLRSGDIKCGCKTELSTTVESRLNEGVVAQVATDAHLREVVWGDPMAHVMALYSGRIEILAVGAVTAKGY